MYFVTQLKLEPLHGLNSFSYHWIDSQSTRQNVSGPLIEAIKAS